MMRLSSEVVVIGVGVPTTSMGAKRLSYEVDAEGEATSTKRL